MPPSKSSSDGLTRVWAWRGLFAWLLLPVGLLFFFIVALRRWFYRRGWLAAERLPVPVIVVGNIVTGGAGKTPLTLWLAQRLGVLGRKPGIVSRGYGRDGDTVRKVGAGDMASVVGDEPLLLARRAGCPVFVGADRVAAAHALLQAHPECDLILCDDGLQHYRLRRDFEIVVLDRRGLMNGWPLPAGPLREPATRLSKVDALVLNATEWPPVTDVPTFRMQLSGGRFYRLDNPDMTCTASDFAGRRLHALAGIGAPQRFFDHLAALGLDCETHAFPDHHRYVGADFDFAGDAILTTEKDALKCAGLTAMPIWVLPVDAVIDPDLARFILDSLEKTDGPATA